MPEGSDGSGVVAASYARQRAAAPVAAVERHTSTSSVGRIIRVEHRAATLTTEGYVIIALSNLSQTRTSTNKALIGFPQVILVVKIT